MLIRIKNLRLRTIIGTNDWEREKPQEVVINATIEFDGAAAGRSDDIDDTVNYKQVTKRMIEAVESSDFFLLEALVNRLLDVALADPRARRATVEVDKPGALRFAESVSVSGDRTRDGNVENDR